MVESATDSNVFTDADHTKLDGIEASATADQTDAEIRAAVEAATDSNVFTDADHTKLDGIEASADVTDTANVTAAGALMDSEVTNLAQVKAFDSSDYATAAQGITADSALQNVVEDTTPQLGGDLASNGNDILFADNDKAIFGAGSDLQLYHDGTNSYVTDAGTGNLVIGADTFTYIGNPAGTTTAARFNAGGAQVFNHNNSQKLATTSTGIDVTGVITTDGMTTSADINFGDNDKAVFGAGSDLQIYHDGSASYIKDLGTGPLAINTNGSEIMLTGQSGSEYMIRAIQDGAVELFHDANKKLATTSTGIDVTGTVTADGLTTEEDASNLTTLGRFSSGFAYSLIRPSTNATGLEIRTFGGNAIARFLNSGSCRTL